MMLVYERLRDVATETDRILDVGTKTGKNLTNVAGGVVAIDVDINPAADVEYVVADGRRVPFDDDTFDCVVSAQVLEHVAGKDTFINEVERVLRPGGRFLVAFPNRMFPLDPHSLPPFFPWLPKRLVLRYFDLVGDEDQYEYVQDHCFYLTSIRGRRLLERHFESVTYGTLDYSMAYPYIFQSDLGRAYKRALPVIDRVVSGLPFGERLYELAFRHTAYECILE